jgi:uncharacterized membrane protein
VGISPITSFPGNQEDSLMSLLFILARLIHISTGVFWVGAVLFVNFLLGPSVMAAGPDGAKVMQQLVKRHYYEIVIGAATLTIASGMYLVWADSRGFEAAWFATRFGQGISTGMLAAVIAYLLGVFVVRPTLYRMLALGGQMAQALPSERPAIEQQMHAVRGRLVTVGSVTAVILVVAVLSMAVARYL